MAGITVDQAHPAPESKRSLIPSLSSSISDAYYNIYTVWLFTFSDLKTIVFPSTFFGVFNAIACTLEEQDGSHHRHSATPINDVVKRFPLVLFWVWINLLPFAISNQRQPAAIQEDSLNKPWRSLPSHRISPEVARRLMLVFYCFAVIASAFLNNLLQSLTLIVLGLWYNDLGGADKSYIVRNMINASGYTCFISGAMQVAIANDRSALQLMGWWYVVIACIIFSTIQMQDLYDQRGDSIRGRKTMPLVVGDSRTRSISAGAIALWCWFAPWLCGASLLAYVAPASLGLTVAARTLTLTDEAADKATFRMWNLWIISIYSLPLVGAVGKMM